VLALAAACGAGEPPDAGADASADGGPPGVAVQVGGADLKGERWVELGPGAEAAMVRGPQGGQHIWVSVRAQGLWPSKMRVDVTMTLLDSGVTVKPGTVPLLLTLKPGADGWVEAIGMTAYVKCPCQVVGRPVRIDVALIDLYGLTGAGQATVTPLWDGACGVTPTGSCAEQ
jgi:hypothetical protein